MDELVFTRELDNRIYPHKQLAGAFFISERDFMRDLYTIRPLTIKHLIISIIRNEARTSYWRFLRLLYKLGFIEISEAEVFSWKNNFRWIPRRGYKIDQKV